MTVNGRRQLRYPLSRDTEQGERARDIQGALDTIPVVFLRTVETTYSEPLTIGTLPSRPEGVELLNIVDQNGTLMPVLCGSLCAFEWKPDNGGAQVTSIDGMSVGLNGGKRYRFTFRITYKAQ